MNNNTLYYGIEPLVNVDKSAPETESRGGEGAACSHARHRRRPLVLAPDRTNRTRDRLRRGGE
jgi:hypothetical protein